MSVLSYRVWLVEMPRVHGHIWWKPRQLYSIIGPNPIIHVRSDDVSVTEDDAHVRSSCDVRKYPLHKMMISAVREP